MDWDNILSGVRMTDPEDPGSAVKTVDGKPVSSPVRNVDADTLDIGGDRYRLAGMNAPETAKVKGGVFIPPNVAGNREQKNINAVAAMGGFDNLVPTGQKDAYGRIIAKQTNSVGDSLGDAATALGLTEINPFSSTAAVGQNTTIHALAKILPELAQGDPMIKLALDEHERRVKEAGGNPLYIPKTTAKSEAEYAAIKGMVGIKAMAEQVKEIDRIENILKDPNLDESAKVKLNGMLEKARDQLFIAGTIPDFVAGVDARQGDRTIMNKAYNQLSTTWNSAILEVKKQTYGFLELVGEQSKWDYLKDVGTKGAQRQKIAQGLLPDTLNSIKDIPGDDSWETITNAATYAGNLVAGTLPMMAVIMASAAAAPAGMLGVGISSIPAAMLYSGGFYTEQPDDKKNASLAVSAGVGAAVLDRLGLDAMMGGNLFSKIGREEVITALIQSQKAASREAAEKMMKDATKSVLVEMSEAGAQFAHKHYASRQAQVEALRAIGVASVGEGVTESGQQLLEMFAKSGEIDPNMRYEKGFYDQLLDAAVGGGLMGGGFHSIGTAIDMAGWHAAADAKKEFEGTLSDKMQFQAHQRRLAESGAARADTLEGSRSVLDALQRLDVMQVQDLKGLNELEGNPGYWNGFMSIVKDPLSFFRGLGPTMSRKLRRPDGSFKLYTPILRSLMDGGILPGDTIDGFRQRIIGEMQTPDVDHLATELKLPVRAVSPLLRKAWQEVWSNGGTLQLDTPENIILQRWKDSADQSVATVKDLMSELGMSTTNIDALDAAFVDAAIDPQHIRQNDHRVIDKLVATGLDGRTARTTVDDLLSHDPLRMKSAKDILIRHGVFRDPQLNDLFEPNIVDAFENYKHRLSTQVANRVYFGEDGINLAKLIELARTNGEFNSEAEYKQTVQNAKDAYAIATGTYESLRNYPNIEKVVGWGVTVTMLASLGKAAFSSIPEIALSTLGAPGNRVGTQLKNTAATLVEEIKADINKGISSSTSAVGLAYARKVGGKKAIEEREALVKEREDLLSDPDTTEEQWAAHSSKVKKFHKKHLGRSLFERLGFNDSGYNSQARFETDSANMKNAMRIFSSFILLRSMTDATRVGALSISADILNSKLHSLLPIPFEARGRAIDYGEGIDKEQFQSIKELQSWGMDVGKVLNYLDTLQKADPVKMEEMLYNLMNGGGVDKKDAVIFGMSDPDVAAKLTMEQYEGYIDKVIKDLEQEILTTTRNMVNQKVVHPGMGNLPKYYHDPKLRVLTTMTRFIGAMTSTVLPRLYRDYIKDGNAGMRYQAFSVMAMALFFAHFANLLKDVLSYGDDESPYLKSNVKKMQRNLYGSGLLGRVESLVDTAMPLYSTRKADPSKEPIKYVYDSVKNAAPPVSWADRAVRAMYNIGSGNTEQGVKQAVRSLPVVGSYPIAAEVISKQFKE